MEHFGPREAELVKKLRSYLREEVRLKLKCQNSPKKKESREDRLKDLQTRLIPKARKELIS